MSLRALVRPFLGLTLVVSFALTLEAQLNRGVIEGVVTDPQGAAVPDVAIKVTSIDTNVVLPTKTNGAGFYRVIDLVPGDYRVTFQAGGFSILDLTNVKVSAGEVIRADAQLKLGTSVQSVQVAAEVPLVETGASDFSTTVDTRTIRDTPLQGRDLQQLVFQVPGVVANGPPGSNFGFNSQFGSFPDPTHVQGSDVSVNGGKSGASAWYLDGNLNLSSMAQNVVVNPSPDATSEFQAITTAFSAEYGRTGGAVFNVVLTSGTNKVHGSLYEYGRNSFFNARNPFTSISASGEIIPQNQLHYNNFGGTLGGPVVLPHIYNGKNKTFFFFSWDTSLLHLNGNQVFTVPTPLMRQGNFSEDPNTALYGIWNPYSTVGPNSNGIFQRTAFGTPSPGNPYGANGCQNSAIEAGATTNIRPCNFSPQLPPSMLDPTAMFFVKSFPLPNYLDPLATCTLAQGGAYRICNNYLGSVGSSQDSHNISLKIDENWSDKSHFFAEWLFNPLTYNNNRLPWTGPTFPAVGFGSNLPFDMTNQIIAIGHTYTLTPTLINEFRASYSRGFYTTHPEMGGYPDSISGVSAVQQQLAPFQIPEFPPTPVPSWYINTPGGGSMAFGAVAWTNNKMATDAYTILDNVTKVVSNHTLKMGFMYRLEHAGQFQSGPTVLSFPGEGVADPTTGLGGGSGLAQFELGAAMNKFGDNYNAYSWNPYLSWPYWGFYLQDDFHITPRFTLNIGLRYDIFGAFRTRQHPDSRFCFSCPNPATGLPGQVQYEGQPGFPEGSAVAGSNYNDLGPRLNFAWSANGKTVVRGGYDIFYSNEYEAINSIQSFVNIPGWANNSYWTGSFDPSRCAAFSGQCVAWPLSSQTPKAPLATPPITLAFPAQQNSQVLGGYMQPTSKPSHDPMVQTWTLQIEHQLPDKMALTLGYTGTHGTHLLGGQYNYNHVPTAALLKYRASINSVVPITDFYSGLTAKALTQAFGTPDLPISTLTQRYPFWPFFVAGQTFDGTNIYHALNVRLKKQYSRGLQWNLTYTFSKNIVNPFAAWGSTSGFTVDPIHNYRQGFTGGMFGALGVDQPFSAPWQNYDNINEDRALAPYDIPQMLTITGTYELPFGSGRRFINHKGVLNGIIGGWQLTGMFNAQSGVPLTITGPCNGVTCRPNLVGDPTSFGGSRTKAQQIAQWFNPAAFAPVFGNDPAFWANPDVNSNSWWQFGTAGIDLPGARSPGFWNLDSSLLKDFHIGEEHYFQFRWEVFNTLNHQNLGLPNTRYCLPPGPNGQTNLVQQAGCTFGEITNVQTDPRAMEFALKFVW